MPAPSIMVAWQGTAPGSFGGVDVWKHQVTLYLRARETFDGDPPTADRLPRLSGARQIMVGSRDRRRVAAALESFAADSR